MTIGVQGPGRGEAPGPVGTGAPRLLLPGAATRYAVVVLLVCVAVTALLGTRYARQTQAGRLDAAIDSRIRAAIGAHATPLNLVVHLGDLGAVTLLATVLLLACLAVRYWRGAALVVIAVPVASALTKILLQPWIHRTLTGWVSFPSGHATGAFVIAVTFLVLLVNLPYPRVPVAARIGLAAAALGAAWLVAVALVALDDHYATDTVGGATVATAVVLLVALGLDRLPVPGRVRAGKTT
jgi:membrane-associated phospholipid phosphatase